MGLLQRRGRSQGIKSNRSRGGQKYVRCFLFWRPSSRMLHTLRSTRTRACTTNLKNVALHRFGICTWVKNALLVAVMGGFRRHPTHVSELPLPPPNPHSGVHALGEAQH